MATTGISSTGPPTQTKSKQPSNAEPNRSGDGSAGCFQRWRINSSRKATANVATKCSPPSCKSLPKPLTPPPQRQTRRLTVSDPVHKMPYEEPCDECNSGQNLGPGTC